MKCQNPTWLMAVLLVLIMDQVIACQQSDTKQSSLKLVQWRRGYKEARKEAETRKLPNFVFLYAPTSLYDQKFLTETLQHPES